MEFTLEPTRVQTLLEQVLLKGKSGVNLDTISGHFTKTGVAFRDMSLEVLIMAASYGKKFFLNYDCSKTEDIPLSKSLLEQLSYGFGSDEKVKVYTSEDKIFLEGKTDLYEETLMSVEPGEVSVEFTTDEKLGIIPKSLNPFAQVLIDPTDLAQLARNSEELRFIGDGKDIEVIIEDVGTRTKTIVPIKVGREETDKGGYAKIMDEFEMSFSSRLFYDSLKQFTGQVWLTFRKDAVVMHQREKHFMLTYAMTSR